MVEVLFSCVMGFVGVMRQQEDADVICCFSCAQFRGAKCSVCPSFSWIFAFLM